LRIADLSGVASAKPDCGFSVAGVCRDIVSNLRNVVFQNAAGTRRATLLHDTIARRLMAGGKARAEAPRRRASKGAASQGARGKQSSPQRPGQWPRLKIIDDCPSLPVLRLGGMAGHARHGRCPREFDVALQDPCEPRMEAVQFTWRRGQVVGAA
jgi:hypothetical protein